MGANIRMRPFPGIAATHKTERTRGVPQLNTMAVVTIAS